ncbi:hypothetical protein [Candidatus Solirubrobacter pratensis]|uniref:hypothetical protein n=1 Tax=Candidatus Solirubrobacter pratensis TaxID=1298857 RepID=UPI0012DD2AB4|nr:hypothetical protein [Candidatus Solirubrobacter pratensis]
MEREETDAELRIALQGDRDPDARPLAAEQPPLDWPWRAAVLQDGVSEIVDQPAQFIVCRFRE